MGAQGVAGRSLPEGEYILPVVFHASDRVDIGWTTDNIRLYDWYMTQIAVSGAREHLAEVIDDARRTGGPVYVTKRGRPVAVILDPDVYERLLAEAEEASDRVELELARAENDFVPWEEVKADLGLA